MATREEVGEHLVRPLTANYGHIKVEDGEAFRDLLVRAMAPHSVEAIRRAVDKIVMTRKYKSWPTIADIVDTIKATGQAGKGDGKTMYPTPMRGVDATNFWIKSQEFVERDYEARGTCLHLLRKGTAQWESWAIYLDRLGLDLAVLRANSWYGPSEWPWQFDTENGQHCSVPVDFVEYEVEPTYRHDDDAGPSPEEKQKVVEMWAELRQRLLKQGAEAAII